MDGIVLVKLMKNGSVPRSLIFGESTEGKSLGLPDEG